MSPLLEPERFIYIRCRQAEYPIPLVIGELPSHVTKIEEREKESETISVVEIKVRDVSIPRPTNMMSCIQKLEVVGRYELKQSMKQILHTNGQFTGLSHEDP